MMVGAYRYRVVWIGEWILSGDAEQILIRDARAAAVRVRLRIQRARRP
jgi:hypothetical protein